MLYRNDILDAGFVVVAMVIGLTAGLIVAIMMDMIQILAMVAFQHGAGGIAVFLISFVELKRETSAYLPTLGKISGLLGLVTGAATFSGSMIASGKLANKAPRRKRTGYQNGIKANLDDLPIVLKSIAQLIINFVNIPIFSGFASHKADQLFSLIKIAACRLNR